MNDLIFVCGISLLVVLGLLFLILIFYLLCSFAYFLYFGDHIREDIERYVKINLKPCCFKDKSYKK